MTHCLPTASPRAAGSGSHDSDSAYDMSWQWSEQGLCNKVPSETPKRLSKPQRQSFGWRGDPADIVAASAAGPTGLLLRLADALPDWHAEAACAGVPVAVLFFPRRARGRL